MSKNGSSQLEWEAPEHEHKERSSDWFWVTGIITLAIIFVSIIVGNIIFGILVLVSAISLTIFINKKPENLKLAVTEGGVEREGIFYPFETLESFWIDLEHPHNKIIIKSKKMLMPLIIVPLAEGANVEEIRNVMMKNIQEEYHSLPLLEKLLEYLGF